MFDLNSEIYGKKPYNLVPKMDSEENLISVKINVNNKQINKTIIKDKRHIPSMTDLQSVIMLNSYCVVDKFNT